VTERLLTTRELAEFIGFSPATIQDWFERGKIPGFRIGGRLRFRAIEVERWLEEQRRAPRREPRMVLRSAQRD
jgi:excisionase family DNA binding protein